MAQEAKRPTTETDKREEPSVDGQEGLDRLRTLTRHIVNVPKSELDIPPSSPTKPKRRKRKRA